MVRSLQWRHNERDGVSNPQSHDCLLNGLFRHRSKKTWKLRVTGLCAGNSLVTGEFPAQKASSAENVSIWWRHHVTQHDMKMYFLTSEWNIFGCLIWDFCNVRDTFPLQNDVIKWKQFPRYWLFVRGIHRSPVNSPHKGQWRGALMFSLICVWINGWVKNREAGDLRRYRVHYDVTVVVLISVCRNGFAAWEFSFWSWIISI